MSQSRNWFPIRALVSPLHLSLNQTFVEYEIEASTGCSTTTAQGIPFEFGSLLFVRGFLSNSGRTRIDASYRLRSSQRTGKDHSIAEARKSQRSLFESNWPATFCPDGLLMQGDSPRAIRLFEEEMCEQLSRRMVGDRVGGSSRKPRCRASKIMQRHRVAVLFVENGLKGPSLTSTGGFVVSRSRPIEACPCPDHARSTTCRLPAWFLRGSRATHLATEKGRTDPNRSVGRSGRGSYARGRIHSVAPRHEITIPSARWRIPSWSTHFA